MPSSRVSSRPMDWTQRLLCLLHWQVGSLPPAPSRKPLFVAHGIFSCGIQALSWDMRDPVPWPGIKPRLSALGAQSLATGPPGKYAGGVLNPDYTVRSRVENAFCNIMMIS